MIRSASAYPKFRLRRLTKSGNVSMSRNRSGKLGEQAEPYRRKRRQVKLLTLIKIADDYTGVIDHKSS